MANFIEVVIKDNANNAVKRMINTEKIFALDSDSSGRVTVVTAGAGVFASVGAGSARISTYESYNDVAARLGQVGPSNPTVAVSSADYDKATANRQADAQAAQQANASTTQGS